MELKWSDAVNVLGMQQGWGWLEHCGRRGRERTLIMQHIHVDNIYNQTACSQPGLEPTCIFERQIVVNFLKLRNYYFS